MASFFCCPNASASLLRLAVRGVSSKALSPLPCSSSRWISHSTARTGMRLGGHFHCKKTRVVSAVSTLRHKTSQQTRFMASKVVRDYEDLPRDYRDQYGLPFRDRDLTAEGIRNVFGPDMGIREGNRLLRVLHGRRVAGTLDDPAFTIHTAGYTEEQKDTAMAYLRKTTPVNEVYNAGLRAEDELNQLDYQEELNAKQLQVDRDQAQQAVYDGRLAKEDFEAEQRRQVGLREAEKAKHEQFEAAVAAGEYKPDPVYGDSRFDKIRFKNKLRSKTKEQEREVIKQRAEDEEKRMIRTGEIVVAEDGTRLPTNPKVREYWLDATTNIPLPEMSKWERIGPSAVVALLVLGFLAAISTVYEEPADRYRLFREVSPAWATVGTIVGINFLVLALFRVPPMWKFLNRRLLVIGLPKPFQLFTAMFCHLQPGHFLMNMAPLLLLGPKLHEEIGRADFLLLYLACGSLGFLASLITYTARNMLTVSITGASGAVLGIYSAYFWGHRTDGFKFFGVPDNGIHGIVFWALLFAPQLAGVVKMKDIFKIDAISHIGGMLTGVVGMEMLQRLKHANKEQKVFELISGPDGQGSRAASQSQKQTEEAEKDKALASKLIDGLKSR